MRKRIIYSLLLFGGRLVLLVHILKSSSSEKEPINLFSSHSPLPVLSFLPDTTALKTFRLKENIKNV
jgi:hypothetical protein